MSKKKEEAFEPKIDSSTFEIRYTLDDVNNVLTALGEIPAKHSIQIIGFLKGKAEQQVQAELARQIEANKPKDTETPQE